MDAAVKYGKSYFLPPEITYDWAKKETIERAPVWCSVVGRRIVTDVPKKAWRRAWMQQ